MWGIQAMHKIGNNLYEKFEMQEGLRQRTTIAPLLFNITLEIVLQKTGNKHYLENIDY